MTKPAIELRALDMLQEIARYKTYEEVMATSDNDDTKQSLHEEIMSDSSDTLDGIIHEARRILKAGE